MATSRPIRRGEWLTHIQGHNIGMSHRAVGDENPVEYVRQEDFAIQDLFGQRCAQEACVRIFGVTWPPSEDTYQAAITNGTAPGLYVREGDDTSNWEVYREVLARRVDEAMATRSGVETTATVRRFGPGPRKCSTNGLFIGVTAPYHIEWSGTAMFYMYSDGRREQTETTLEHCLNGVRSGSYVELPVGLRTVEARVGETAAPLPEVAQARGDAAALAAARAMPTATTRQNPADVRKVSSSPPQTVADVSGIEAAVSDEVRRRVSSPLVSDETTRQRVVSPVPPAPAVDVRLQFGGERETTASRIRQEVQRELDRQYGRIDASSSPSPPPTLPSPPSRFSLLEIDTDTDAKDASPSPSNAPVDLAALQAELRAEREARRALAAAQTPPGRFDLLECDLPAVVVKTSTKATKTPQARPAASSSPPRRPIETITDLTVARSPLELARMLEGLNDELSTMMRQREAN